jgi:MarR family transcriptional regulator, transcriptional regulator for hemolysin
MEKLERTIATRIGYISRLLRTRFDLRARSFNLTRAQWQTIATIRFHGGATQREIAEKLEVGSVTIGRIVERLEQAGWIERRPDPADRRAYRLHMDPRSQPMLEQLTVLGEDEERIALEGISAEERHLLIVALDRIISNLERNKCVGYKAAEEVSQAANG